MVTEGNLINFECDMVVAARQAGLTISETENVLEF